MSRRWSTSLLTCALTCWLAAAGRADDAAFRQRVAPLLEKHCVSCHSGESPKGALDLTTARGLTTGGESGAAIVAGKPDESLLVAHVSGAKPEMPKDAPPLPADEVAALREWVAAGASWPEGLVLADKRVIDTQWWSLGPRATVAVPPQDDPWLRTPLDAFVLARLRQERLSPSAEADRRTLIRRLSYDLHGLPPTPAEIEAFVNDPSETAYDELVDLLLASPRYGERWGRHWLDVVHFGESHGYDKDKPRPHAWPYRDYVIDSLNADKPYDRFVAEQIAGDVLWPDDPQAIVATAFIAAGPWDFVGHVELREGTSDKEIARSNDRDDMVASAMSTFVSLTVHCARCHDHKFDPIKQREYYSLQAVFAGVDRADRRYEPDLQTARQRKLLVAQKAASARAAVAGVGAGFVGEIKAIDDQLAALPPIATVYATASVGGGPRPIPLLARGDVKNPGEPVAPGGVTCVSGPSASFVIADANDEGQRRAALAHWLVDPSNALLRRSIVNRVWQYHFGRGLVDTPNDFGRMGSQPSHPELLEWLAGWFADHGHSLKDLHRLILLSATYRQRSESRPDYEQIDAQNRFLWRMNRTRLDAECIRDAVLAVSGQLNLETGGPSVQQFFFKDDHSPIYDYARFDVDDPRALRRSVYRFLVRSVPDPLMECLDCADPSIMTPKRNATLTALQALSLLNNPLIVRQSEHFAARLEREHAELPARIEAAYRLALGRSPSAEELAIMSRLAQQHGLANACRVLFNTNEFVFVD